MNPHLYGQLIYNKGGKNIQWGKDSLFNKWFWKNWTATCKIIKLDYSFTSYTKINWKWIKDLNVKPGTIRLLGEGSKLFDIGLSNIFFGYVFSGKGNKSKKWDCIKLKCFCTVKETIYKTKRPPTEWEKIFAKDISDSGLIVKIYKERKQLSIKKQPN